MDQYRLTSNDIGNADLFTVAPIPALFQLVLSGRDTADPRHVVAVRQFDGMADMLPVVGDRPVGALSSIFPEELEGVSITHNRLLRDIDLHDGHGVVWIVLEWIELPVNFLIHRDTDDEVHNFGGIHGQGCL